MIDVLIEDAAGDAETLAGEFEDLAADAEVSPEHVAGGENEADEGRREKQASNKDADGGEQGGGEGAEIESLRGAAFPKRVFISHGTEHERSPLPSAGGE